MDEFLRLDLMPLLTVSAAAGLLAFFGALLVLDRRALLGDAMAHAVLPGLVIAFIITGTRAPLPMFLGALSAALVAAVASQGIQRYARVETTAAIGIVFTTLFALGVVLVESTGARNVDLDLECVLSGQLELLFWSPPSENGLRALLASLPSETRSLGLLLVLPPALLWFWGPVRATLFDSSFARVGGLRPRLVRAAILAATTVVIVASFEALGSILVIALLTCPAATARLVCRSTGTYLGAAVGVGLACAVLGYFAATSVAPLALGHSIDASGSVATLAGFTLGVTALLRRA